MGKTYLFISCNEYTFIGCQVSISKQQLSTHHALLLFCDSFYVLHAIPSLLILLIIFVFRISKQNGRINQQYRKEEYTGKKRNWKMIETWFKETTKEKKSQGKRKTIWRCLKKGLKKLTDKERNKETEILKEILQ